MPTDAPIMQSDRIDPDGFDLPRPRDMPGTGGRIVTMVLATPGVLEGYPGGAQYVPPSTLSDPEYVDALAGVPVVDDDVGAHHDGVDTTSIERESIGRILRAWWDEERQALMAEAVIDVERGLEKLRAGVTGVSPAYSVWVTAEDGEIDGVRYARVQRKRLDPNNVAITSRPRGIRSHLRADSFGARMTPDLARVLLSLVPADDAGRPFLQRVADADVPDVPDDADAEEEADPLQMLARAVMKLKARFDESEGERAALREEVDAMKAGPEADPEPADDADPEEEEEEEEASAVADSAGRWRVAILAADAAGVTIDDTWNLDAALRAAANGLSVRHADSLTTDALSSVLDLAVRQRTQGDAWSRITNTTTQHSSGDPAAWPVR